MSLVLDLQTIPEGLEIRTWSGRTVYLGDYEISIEDFLAAAYYVLTNTDLNPNDPRLQFVKCIQAMKEVDGYSEGEKHLASNIPVLPPTRPKTQ